jgi:hypothetical protein
MPEMECFASTVSQYVLAALCTRRSVAAQLYR